MGGMVSTNFILIIFIKKNLQQQTSTGALKNSDTVLVLAYSLTMLNTDAHNPQVNFSSLLLFLYFWKVSSFPSLILSFSCLGEKKDEKR